MKNIVSWDDSRVLRAIKHELDDGRVVITSTDTILGLLAPLTHQGFEQLNAVKGRQHKPYLILIADQKKVSCFADIDALSKEARLLAQACWPGPLTIVMRAKSGLPDYISADGTVALRVPHHAGLLQLLTQYDGLFSTSANRAGNPPVATIDALDSILLNQVQLIVTDHTSSEIPSTIIDASSDSVRMIREGAYTRPQLEKIISQNID